MISKIKDKGLTVAVKTHSKAKEIKKEVRKQVTTAMIAALGFIIALVWRDAIKKLIDSIAEKLSLSQTAYLHDVIAALIITIVCVVGIMLISRYTVKEEK